MQNKPPGWYRAPDNPSLHSYWSGHQWVESAAACGHDQFAPTFSLRHLTDQRETS